MFNVSFNIFFEINSPTYLCIICIDKTFYGQILLTLYSIFVCFSLTIIKINHRQYILFKSLPRRIVNPCISISCYTNSIRFKETSLPLCKLLFRFNRDKQLEHFVTVINPIPMFVRFKDSPRDTLHAPELLDDA